MPGAWQSALAHKAHQERRAAFLLLPWPDRMLATVASFPDASKISSRFGQNLVTALTMGRSQPPPCTPPGCRNGCRYLGARFLQEHFPWDWTHASSGHTHIDTVRTVC